MNWSGSHFSTSVPTRAQGFWRRQDLLDDVRARLAAGEGFALATLNLDHVVKLQRDTRFAQAYRAQTHVTADGWPVRVIEGLSGGHAELVPGSDLVVPLVREAAHAGRPIALVGGTPEMLDSAATALSTLVPGADIALRVAPSQTFDPEGGEADRIIGDLRDLGSALCLLALGAPKQEILAERLRDACPPLGIASIGAGLDFIAGTQTRAPAMMRALKVEWLWRLAGNPRRLSPRYARCAALLPSLVLRALRHRLAHASGAQPAPTTSSSAGGAQTQRVLR